MTKTLLLADDSVTIQKVVGITFANEDVHLVTAPDGDDALRKARELKPDLVMADIGMPGLDGYELCAAIRPGPSRRMTRSGRPRWVRAPTSPSRSRPRH